MALWRLPPPLSRTLNTTYNTNGDDLPYLSIHICVCAQIVRVQQATNLFCFMYTSLLNKTGVVNFFFPLTTTAIVTASSGK